MSVIYVALAALGVVLGALYLLHMIQGTMFGELDEEKNGAVNDINGREITYLLPIVLMSFFMGIQPQIFLRDIEPAVVRTLSETFENMSEEQLQRARSWSATRTRAVQEWQSQSPGEEWSIQKSHAKSHGDEHGEASEGHGDEGHDEGNH
jgi:hypothetical protein